jgi:hypothetical protein
VCALRVTLYQRTGGAKRREEGRRAISDLRFQISDCGCARGGAY